MMSRKRYNRPDFNENENGTGAGYLLILFALMVLGVAGCQEQTPDQQPAPTINPADLVQADETPVTNQIEESALARPYGYTYQRADGNRLVAGHGNVPELTPLDIELAGEPQWVTAVPLARGVLWGVVLVDGRTQVFLVADGQVTPIDSNELTPQIAPVMTVDPQNGRAIFLNPPAADPEGSNPVIYNEAGHLALSNPAGELFLVVAGQAAVVPEVAVLPDGRILFDEAGRLLMLTDPTDRYDHGVLGDPFEGGSITMLATVPDSRVVATIPVAPPQVIEGIMPLWVDWNSDGQREIIVTLSDAQQGAQINLFSEAGELLAQGPAVGRGGRWRHQIAVAPFGPNGELELVDVLTPHIGGVVEFYRWQGDQLAVVAELPGYTSHVIGTNNLDMALAGDFNGDGRVELLLPTQDRRQLGGLQRTEAGVDVVYQLDLGGEVVTNLAGVLTSEGNTAVGLGRPDNVLRIWQP